MKKNNICVQCGYHRETIKKDGLLCGIMSSGEEPELIHEWQRHRFKPYSEKELAKRQAEEDYNAKSLGDMADFYNEKIKCLCGWSNERYKLEYSNGKFVCPDCKKEI
jgi:hypothetical protein